MWDRARQALTSVYRRTFKTLQRVWPLRVQVPEPNLLHLALRSTRLNSTLLRPSLPLR